MSELGVRRAEARDLMPLLELHLALQDHLESANPDLWRMTRQARQQLEGQLAARIAAPESCILVAEEERCLVGTVSGRIVTNTRYVPARAGVIDQLYVIPGHRRRGIGSLLVTELCRVLLDRGVGDVSLRTVHGNAQAMAFWAARGFTPRIVTLGARLTTGHAE